MATVATIGEISSIVSLVSFGGQLVASAFGADSLANILGIISQVSGVLSLASSATVAVGNIFKEGFKSGLSKITTGIKKVGLKIKDGIVTAGQTIWKVVKGIGGFFKDVAVGIGSFAKNAVASLSTNFLGGLAEIGKGIAHGFSVIGKGLVKGVSWLWNGVKWVGSQIGNMFTGAIGNNASITIAQTGVEQVAQEGTRQATQSLAGQMYNNLVTMAVGNATAQTLDDLGVDPTLARLGTAFATGGMTNPTNFFTGALQNMMVQGANELSLHLDLPPPVSQAVSSVAGLVSGNMFDPDAAHIFSNFSSITPQLFGSLTEAGLGYAGLNSQLSQLIGIPVGSAIGSAIAGAYLNQNPPLVDGVRSDGTLISVTAPGYSPTTLFGDFFYGLTNSTAINGIISVSSDFISEKLDISSLLTSLGLRTISSGIEGLSNPYDSRNLTLKFFSGIGEGLKDSAVDILAFGGDSLSSSERLNCIMRISSIADRKGDEDIFDFFEDYATQILTRGTVESVVQSGHNISEYFKLKREMGDFKIGQLDGKVTHEYTAEDGSTYILDEDETNLLARKFGSHYEEGEYGIAENGKFLLKNGRAVFTNGKETLTLTVRDGKVVTVDMSEDGGQSRTFFGTDDEPLILIPDSETSFKIESGMVRNWTTGETRYLSGGETTAIQSVKAVDFTTATGEQMAGLIRSVEYFDAEGGSRGFEIEMDDGLRQQILGGNESAGRNLLEFVIDNQSVATEDEKELSWIEQVQLTQLDLADKGDKAVDKVVEFLKPYHEMLKETLIISQCDQSLFVLEILAKSLVDVLRIGTDIDDIFRESGDLKENWRELDLGERTKKILSIGGKGLNEIFRVLDIIMIGGLLKSGVKAGATVVREVAPDFVKGLLRQGDEATELLFKLFKNASFKAKWLAQVDDIQDVRKLVKGKFLDYGEASSKTIIRNADEVNKMYPSHYNPKPHKPGSLVKESLYSSTDLRSKNLVRVSTEDNIARPWLMKKSDFEAIEAEARSLNRDLGELLQERLQLPNKPTMVSEFVPDGDEIFAVRESIVNPGISNSPEMTQFEVLMEKAEDLLRKWFKNGRPL